MIPPFPPLPPSLVSHPPVLAEGVPVGTVVAFMGEVTRQRVPLATQGWLVCDGAALDVAVWRELFDVIGYSYSASAGGATFNLPDLRGYFLRGVDPRPASESHDKDSGARQRADGTQGAVVGSVQPCALQLHEHDYTPAVSAVAASGGNGGSVGQGTTQTSQLVPQSADTPVLTSPSETRPLNVYVYFLIRATRASSLLNPPLQPSGAGGG